MTGYLSFHHDCSILFSGISNYWTRQRHTLTIISHFCSISGSPALPASTVVRNYEFALFSRHWNSADVSKYDDRTSILEIGRKKEPQRKLTKTTKLQYTTIPNDKSANRLTQKTQETQVVLDLSNLACWAHIYLCNVAGVYESRIPFLVSL